jgi:hypothetical protein
VGAFGEEPGVKEDGVLTEDKWRAICRGLIETGFFDAAGRPKTLKAIRGVMERLPASELESLREKVAIIFAPAPGMNGQVFPLRCPPFSLGEPEENRQRVVVFLSPEIERLSQEKIEATVAHEFAHALLHAPDSLEGWFIEPEADQKVRSWGFKGTYPKVTYPGSKEKG